MKQRGRVIYRRAEKLMSAEIEMLISRASVGRALPGGGAPVSVVFNAPATTLTSHTVYSLLRMPRKVCRFGC